MSLLQEKTPKRLPHRFSGEKGQTIVAYLVFLLLASTIIAGALRFSSGNLRTAYATKKRASRLYKAERDLGRTLSWLRENSKNMLSAFTANEFYAHFVTGTPSLGDNDKLYRVPTQLKAINGNDSIIISNSSDLATGNFPTTTNSETGQSFNALSSFQVLGLESLVRITLINAVPAEPGRDHGPPPAQAPSTAFAPVYRVDVMSGTDEGMHLQSYISSEIEGSDGGVGFYGSESVNVRGAYCDAYDSSLGLYGASNKLAECEINSLNNLSVARGSAIYGSLNTLKNLHMSNGVLHCSDFEPGCPNPGSSCEGDECTVATLPSSDPWSSLCPAQQPRLRVTSDTTLFVAGDSPLERCWEEIVIANGVTLTLATTEFAYYFEKLSLGRNSVLKAEPATADGSISLYFRSLSPKTLTGATFVNTTGKPTQLSIAYLDNAPLKLDGNDDMAMFLSAPLTSVTTRGNFDFFGGITAKNLHFDSGVGLHFDTNGSGGEPQDILLQIRDQAQTFR